MNIEPPDTCPICGAEEDRRDTRDDGQAERVWYICGACWAVWRSAAPKAEWISDCGYAMHAALRCHATLHPTALETARAAVVEAEVARYHAYAAWDVVFNDPESDADQLEPLTEACKAACEAVSQATAAYVAVMEAAK